MQINFSQHRKWWLLQCSHTVLTVWRLRGGPKKCDCVKLKWFILNPVYPRIQACWPLMCWPATNRQEKGEGHPVRLVLTHFVSPDTPHFCPFFLFFQETLSPVCALNPNYPTPQRLSYKVQNHNTSTCWTGFRRLLYLASVPLRNVAQTRNNIHEFHIHSLGNIVQQWLVAYTSITINLLSTGCLITLYFVSPSHFLKGLSSILKLCRPFFREPSQWGPHNGISVVHRAFKVILSETSTDENIINCSEVGITYITFHESFLLLRQVFSLWWIQRSWYLHSF